MPNPGCILVGIVHPAFAPCQAIASPSSFRDLRKESAQQLQVGCADHQAPCAPPAQEEKDLQCCALGHQNKQGAPLRGSSITSLPTPQSQSTALQPIQAVQALLGASSSAGTQGLSRAVLHLLESADRTGIECSCTARCLGKKKA